MFDPNPLPILRLSRPAPPTRDELLTSVALAARDYYRDEIALVLDQCALLDDPAGLNDDDAEVVAELRERVAACDRALGADREFPA